MNLSPLTYKMISYAKKGIYPTFLLYIKMYMDNSENMRNNKVNTTKEIIEAFLLNILKLQKFVKKQPFCNDFSSLLFLL